MHPPPQHHLHRPAVHPRRRPSVPSAQSAVLAGLVGRLRRELVLAGVVGVERGVDAVSDEVAAHEGEYELVCSPHLFLFFFEFTVF